jgi:uncharacterized membrane protein YccF (DUF307 family)
VNLIYTPLIGFPLAVCFYAIGILFFLTIIGIPIGLACCSLAGKVIVLGR